MACCENVYVACRHKKRVHVACRDKLSVHVTCHDKQRVDVAYRDKYSVHVICGMIIIIENKKRPGTSRLFLKNVE